MSVKKLLVLAAAAATATAFAGGSTSYTMASNNTHVSSGAFSPYSYVDVNFGYGLTGLKKQAGSDATDTWKNSGNSWVYGGDIGYMFMKHLGIEFGGTGFTPAKIGDNGDGYEVKYKQYDLYVAAKMAFSLTNDLNLFGKVGVDYHHFKVTDHDPVDVDFTANHFGPTFGAGLDYTFMPNLHATFQWRHLVSFSKAIAAHHNVDGSAYTVPGQDLLTLGIGYNFAM